MKYVSTRAATPEPVDFVTAALAGLAPDGGLYSPMEYPRLEPAGRSESYTELATRILSAFAGDAISEQVIGGIVERAYAPFDHKAVTPLVQVGAGRWMLELHHGPTLAFKDVAMRFIAQLYDYILTQRGDRMTILCATSGDTGGAAASAFAGSKAVDIVILHPHERISPTQRLFMTATGAPNVHNLALEGDFDGTQAILKSLIGDQQFKQKTGLAAVNSINWARVAAQTVYFAFAQAQLGATPATFVVPTGNFGDALAGYVAYKCGLLPTYSCVAAVNENDTMRRLLVGEPLVRRETTPTLSPAMDIQTPSNVERLLFEASGRDGAAVRKFYRDYADNGRVEVPEKILAELSGIGLTAELVTDAQTRIEMKRTFDETGWTVCPHSAVGLAAARRVADDKAPIVSLATAHAAKFPETIREVLGQDAPLPPRAVDVAAREEVFETGPMSDTFVRDRIEAIFAAH